ncbi:MAG: hypothetical protein LQ346_008899 [Caloplaca aetnensis]|nr:MAG: hypothetical protein LQ346_008899 [Caloplaca aetnensis]
MPALPATVVTATGNATLPVIISTLLNISDVLNNPTLTKMDKTFWVAGMYYTVFAFLMYALYIGYLILKCHRHYHPRRPSHPDRECEKYRNKQMKEALGYDSSVDLWGDFENNPGGFRFHSDLSTLVNTRKDGLFAGDARDLVSVEKYGHDKKSLSTRTCAYHDVISDCFPGCTDTLIDGTVVEDAPLVRNLDSTEQDFKSKQTEGLSFEPDHPRSLSQHFKAGEDCKEHGSYHVNKVNETLEYDSIAEPALQLAYNHNDSLLSPDDWLPTNVREEVAADLQTPEGSACLAINFHESSVTHPRQVIHELNGFDLVRFDYTLPAEMRNVQQSSRAFQDWMQAILDGIPYDAGYDSRVQLEQNVVVTPHGFSYLPADSIYFVNDKAFEASQNEGGHRFGNLRQEFYDWVREDVVSWYHATHCETFAQGKLCQSCRLCFEKANPMPQFLLPSEGGKLSGSD